MTGGEGGIEHMRPESGGLLKVSGGFQWGQSKEDLGDVENEQTKILLEMPS